MTPDMLVMDKSDCYLARSILLLVGFLGLTACTVDAKIIKSELVSISATVDVVLSSTATSPNNLSSIPVTVDFGTVEVTGLEASDFIVTNGTVSNLAGSGSSYTLDLIPTGSGNFTVSISLPVGAVLNSKMATNLASNTLTFSIDKAPPILTIVGPAITAGSSATNFVFTVNYTDAANITLANADISFGGTDSAGCSAAVTGAGTATRTVTVSGCTGDGTMTISIAANSAADTLGNQALAYGPSSAANVRNSFIASFDTSKTSAGSSANTQLMLPLTSWSGYNFTIDWGDGSSETITSATWTPASPAITHTYASVNTYDIKIKGALPLFQFYNSGDRLKILDVKQWGPNEWWSMEMMFNGCENLQMTAADAPNLTTATSLVGMFSSALAFNSSIGHWDTSHITTMQSMFLGAEAFNQAIGTWNTASVTNFSSMFAGAKIFNQDISTWNTASATNMRYMFYDTDAFNQPIGTWNTANVTDMSAMFASTDSFNQSLNDWVTSNVTDMSGMFAMSQAFNQPISSLSGGRWDTSKVTTMESMFEEAAVFNQDIGNWVTSAVTNMNFIFQNAPMFNQNLSSWDVSNVTTSTNYSAGATNWAPGNKPALP